MNLLVTGRMPQTANLPEPWYASPDGHLCTIRDFDDLVKLVDAQVEEAVAFNTSGQRLPIRHSISLQNLFGEKAVFMMSKTHSA
jgi:methionine biosynthesis protein MetW